MKVERFVKQFGYSMLGALFLTTALPSRALAQDHSHSMPSPLRNGSETA
jgi:hypothetical protein